MTASRSGESHPATAGAGTGYAKDRQEDLMVKREKVTDARGRRWVSGALASDEYFDEARRSAREQARRAVALRIARAGKPARVQPASH